MQVAAAHPALDRLGELTDCDSLIAELAEPLLRSAAVNFHAALRTCSDRCRAYHSVWQYLRLAEVTRAVRVDGPLFVDAAERFARAGRLNRVLVSGSADYSMLAHLAHGAARAGSRVRFDVLDMCETTLRINEWYGIERGLDVRVFRSDVLGFEPEDRYDLICTHSFLLWHPAEQRPMLFRRWHDWLVPGGHLCFSNRVSPTSVPFDPQERAERTEHMVAKSLAKWRALAVPLPCPEREFVALVRKFYDRRREDYPELGLEMLRGWIAAAGLVLDLAVEVAKVLDGPEDVTVISGANAGRPRMWFQARRP